MPAISLDYCRPGPRSSHRHLAPHRSAATEGRPHREDRVGKSFSAKPTRLSKGGCWRAYNSLMGGAFAFGDTEVFKGVLLQPSNDCRL
jgi:hypothetical protein